VAPESITQESLIADKRGRDLPVEDCSMLVITFLLEEWDLQDFVGTECQSRIGTALR